MNYWGPSADFISDVEAELFIKAVLGRKSRKPHWLQDPRFSPLLPSFLSIMSSILRYNFPKLNVRVLGAKHQ